MQKQNGAPVIKTTQNASKQCSEFSDGYVTLQAGRGVTGRSFRVRWDLLCSVSTSFSDSADLLLFFPTDLVEENPVILDMFVGWLEQQEDPRPYIPLQYSEEPWRSYATTAWVFGKTIRATKFERYALSQFITNCVTADLSTWEYIEQRAADRSSLRRFSNHWVAWMCHLAPAGQSEYKDLSAAKLAGAVTDATHDPRVFDIDHWYSTCGDDFNAACIHDPVVRANAVEKSLSIPSEPPPERGRDWEIENKALQKKNALSHWHTPVSGTGSITLPPLPSRKLIKPKPPLPPRLKTTALKPPLPPRPKVNSSNLIENCS